MTKRITTTILILIACALALCGCLPQPFAEQVVSTSNAGSLQHGARVLYVSGAVQNDGFITVPQLCDYKSAMKFVGVTEYTSIPNNLTTLISPQLDKLIVGFEIDGIRYDSVNVNGGYVTLRQSISGVDDYIVNKLADYIEVNGAITNRGKLRAALGDDYAENYFKFYIDIDDYA